MNRDEIIERAKEARKYFSNLVHYNIGLIWVHLHEFDKYGRLLGTFYKNETSEKSINDIMIENGYGYSYFGGTKKN